MASLSHHWDAIWAITHLILPTNMWFAPLNVEVYINKIKHQILSVSRPKILSYTQLFSISITLSHLCPHINPWRVKCVAIYQSDINIWYSPGDHWAQFVLECGKGSHHKIPSSTIINAAVTDSFCKGTLSKTSICVSNNPRMCDASDDMVTWERFSYQQYWPFVRVWSVTRTFVLFS